MSSQLTASFLLSLPPDVLKSLPALQPPAGVQSNFVGPVNKCSQFQVVATFLLCLMTCFYVIRVYTKLYIIRKAGWDDFM